MLQTESIPESESLIFWPLESESESIPLGEYKAGIGIGINSTLPVTDGIGIGIDSACSEAEYRFQPAGIKHKSGWPLREAGCGRTGSDNTVLFNSRRGETSRLTVDVYAERNKVTSEEVVSQL